MMRNFPNIFHKLGKFYSITVVTPGLLQKMSKKCNSPGLFSVLVVFLGVFFRKFAKNGKKIPKCNSPGVKYFYFFNLGDLF